MISSDEDVGTHYDARGERCPLCRKNRLRLRKKSPSPSWLQRYGFVQLYVCDGCRQRYVVQDVNLEPIRRCQWCAEFFIPSRGRQRCCCDEHAEKYLRQNIEDKLDGKRLKEAMRGDDQLQIDRCVDRILGA